MYQDVHRQAEDGPAREGPVALYHQLSGSYITMTHTEQIMYATLINTKTLPQLIRNPILQQYHSNSIPNNFFSETWYFFNMLAFLGNSAQKQLNEITN